MQIKTFPIKIERSFERTMPPRVIAIVRRIAHDITRKSSKGSELDHHLELAHAALHMQLYQRYGSHSSEFLEHAHSALDELIVVGSSRDAHIKLPLELNTTA